MTVLVALALLASAVLIGWQRWRLLQLEASVLRAVMVLGVLGLEGVDVPAAFDLVDELTDVV